MVSHENNEPNIDYAIAEFEAELAVMQQAAAECAWQISPRPREFDGLINPPKGSVSPGHIAFRAAHMEAQTEI